MNPLYGADLLSVSQFEKEDIYLIIDEAASLKKQHRVEFDNSLLHKKTLGMIFQKPSTRTRVSFETGMNQLGGHAIYLNWADFHLGKGKESLADTGKVLSRFVDAIMIRCYHQRDVEVLAESADIPVINGLTDDFHPCQILSDLFTVWERKGRLEGLRLCYLGVPNNISNSLMLACPKVGMHLVVCSPITRRPDDRITIMADRIADKNKVQMQWLENPREAVKNADIVYTDVWQSMGDDKQEISRLKNALTPYQVNGGLLSLAKNDVLFMHCLPAIRNEEVTDDVIDGDNSIVWDQAENRLHLQKAILVKLLIRAPDERGAFQKFE